MPIDIQMPALSPMMEKDNLAKGLTNVAAEVVEAAKAVCYR
jgi:phenylpyruvate tautomerase PptA (4-oxalocrotonate tautomerase family)